MTDNKTCHIWGTPTQIKAHRLNEIVNSPRAGGEYLIDRTGINIIHEDKARLTTWLIDQRRMGVICPGIEANTLEKIRRRPLLSVAARADRLLTFIRQQTPRIGERFHFVNKQTPPCPESDIFLVMKAWSESITHEPEPGREAEDEVMYLLNYLENKNLIEIEPGTNRFLDLHSFAYIITPEGHAYLDELSKTVVNTDQAFVAMWFDDSMDRVYEEAIDPAIEDAGYKPLRIDQKDHNNKIDDEIIVEIKRSRFIIADFTHGKDSGIRGGVYFEAGFALGLGLDVIFTCREDRLSDIHFDTRQYNHLQWKDDNLDDFRKALSNRISATIGDGPHRENINV